MKLPLALVQLCANDNLAQNHQKALNWIRQAAQQGAKLVCLPESFLYIGQRHADYPAIAQPLTGPLMRDYQTLASQLQVELLLGGFPESNPQEPQKTYNTCVWINAQGQLLAHYRKIHLFDTILEAVNLCESKSVSAGTELVTFAHPWGGIGLSICYDLRFPSMYQQLRSLGAEMIFIPAAFAQHTGRAHWHPLLRARAIETQCFVIAPGQTGPHNPKRTSFGHSLVVDPWGKILLELGEEEGIGVIELDLSQLEPIRRQMPVLVHRVPGIDHV